MFLIGDKVICISDYTGSQIIIGKTYTIKDSRIVQAPERIYVSLIEIGGVYFSDRFKINTKEQRKEKLLKIEKICF